MRIKYFRKELGFIRYIFTFLHISSQLAFLKIAFLFSSNIESITCWFLLTFDISWNKKIFLSKFFLGCLVNSMENISYHDFVCAPTLL